MIVKIIRFDEFELIFGKLRIVSYDAYTNTNKAPQFKALLP